jgi:glycosyltransferase involved in cell wall biosynthesis
VILTGWVDRDQVKKQLRLSDVLCMPSLSEGLPVIGVQALAYGLAIVANRAGGLAELVKDGVNGRICDVGDRRCFLDGLRWTLTDRSRLEQLKSASSDMALEYDIRNVAAAYERALGEAAAR